MEKVQGKNAEDLSENARTEKRYVLYHDFSFVLKVGLEMEHFFWVCGPRGPRGPWLNS